MVGRRTARLNCSQAAHSCSSIVTDIMKFLRLLGMSPNMRTLFDRTVDRADPPLKKWAQSKGSVEQADRTGPSSIGFQSRAKAGP